MPKKPKTIRQKADDFAADFARNWFGIFTEGSLEAIARHSYLMGYRVAMRNRRAKTKGKTK
jgi:hypothetical protein